VLSPFRQTLSVYALIVKKSRTIHVSAVDIVGRRGEASRRTWRAGVAAS
jgi:hypothetical protein